MKIKWHFLNILVFLYMILFIFVVIIKIFYNVLPLFIHKFGHTFSISNSVVKVVKYEYKIEYDKNSYTDVNLILLDFDDESFRHKENLKNNEEFGFIIVNQNYWEKTVKLKKKEALENFNRHLGLNLCYIYDSLEVASDGMRLVFRLENLYTKDNWYFFLYMMFFIMILTIFVSIIRNFIFEYFPSINKDDTIFFTLIYNYIFHVYLLSIIIALPGVSMISNNITFDKCLGFSVLSRYSIVLNRKFVNNTTYDNISLQMEKNIFRSTLSLFEEDEKRKNREYLKNLFYFNDWDDDSRNYLNLIVFFCFFIWITKSFRYYKYNDQPGKIFAIFSLCGYLFSLYLTAIPVLNQSILIFKLIGFNSSNLGFLYNWSFLLFTFVIIIIEILLLVISIKNYLEKRKKNFTVTNAIQERNEELSSNIIQQELL